MKSFTTHNKYKTILVPIWHIWYCSWSSWHRELDLLHCRTVPNWSYISDSALPDSWGTDCLGNENKRSSKSRYTEVVWIKLSAIQIYVENSQCLLLTLCLLNPYKCTMYIKICNVVSNIQNFDFTDVFQRQKYELVKMVQWCSNTESLL